MTSAKKFLVVLAPIAAIAATLCLSGAQERLLVRRGDANAASVPAPISPAGFWRHVAVPAAASEVEQYESFADMGEASSASFEGRIESVESVREIGPPDDPSDRLYIARVLVRPDRVLRGELIKRSDGLVAMDMVSTNPESLDHMAANLPAEGVPTYRSLFFVRQKGTLNYQPAPGEDMAETMSAYRFVSSQGLAVDSPAGVEFPLRAEKQEIPTTDENHEHEEGAEAIVDPAEVAQFPDNLTGAPFDLVSSCVQRDQDACIGLDVVATNRAEGLHAVACNLAPGQNSGPWMVWIAMVLWWQHKRSRFTLRPRT